MILADDERFRRALAFYLAENVFPVLFVLFVGGYGLMLVLRIVVAWWRSSDDRQNKKQ